MFHKIPETENLLNVKDWVPFVKFLKEDMWLPSSDHGALSPLVVPIRNDEVLGFLFAPECDKAYAMSGLQIVWQTMNPDGVLVLLDATMYRADNNGQDAEDLQKKYPQGMQHAIDNGYADDNVFECILCNIITPNPNDFQMYNLPYKYGGKGSTLKWLDDSEDCCDFDSQSMIGNVPDSINKIINTPNNKIKGMFEKLADDFGISDPEKRQWHMDRAVFKLFKQGNWVVAAHQKYQEGI